MNFRPLKIFSRCAVFELDNTSCCFSEEAYDIYLNGQLVIADQNKNIFSVYHLLPDTSYKLTVKSKSESITQLFKTTAERVLLDVTKFGAVADGQTDTTSAVQAAVLCCPKGGTVYLPAGVYAVCPLFLKSDMTLLLEKGAALCGIPDRKRYPILPGATLAANESDEYYLGTWEGNPLSSFASLITGVNVENVNIIGEGILDCNAQNGDWWQNPKEKNIAWRPRTVFLNNCKNVTIQGVALKNSYSWTLHSYFCTGLKYLDISIWNPSDSPNTDGIDPESCKNVEILGVHISVGDDCISIKSGKLFMGRTRQVPTENVVIRNCLMERGHGAVVIGSEVSAGIYNVHVSQCLMCSTDRGFRIKTRRGRGRLSVLDDIYLENIQMEHVLAPFTMNMFYFCDPDGHSEYVYSKEALPVDDRTPSIGQLTCRNVHCTNCSVAGMYFYGLPEMPIRKVEMENIYISFCKDAKPGYAAMMDHVEPVCKKGIFARNVQTLTLKNVVIKGYDGEKTDLSGVSCLEEENK